ncbi:MAG: YaiI/YqxD family protein [Gammaproteobacteria bacterium]|nr:MAG: YaiI/YqxD family protein [Gammaproteobacteria bacterium]
MMIWVDADACPVAVRTILCRAAERRRVKVSFVANQPVQVPRSRWIGMVRVASGFDEADHEIVRRLSPGDLVITADIPLAAEVLERGGHALTPRGELFTGENIRARLNMRDFMETMRASGVVTGGPGAFGQAERKAFADELDRFLTRATAG